MLRRRCCCAPATAIDQYLLSAGCSAANPPNPTAAVDQQDKQMNALKLEHFIDPALHTTQAVSIMQ